MNATDFFAEHFKRLKGMAPYPWQRKLFEQIISGNWPQVVDMPTGAGKTAVLWIWWLALAWSRYEKTNGMPVRLTWVVNRRVVVDQVTEEVRELREKWREIGLRHCRSCPWRVRCEVNWQTTASGGTIPRSRR